MSHPDQAFRGVNETVWGNNRGFSQHNEYSRICMGMHSRRFKRAPAELIDRHDWQGPMKLILMVKDLSISLSHSLIVDTAGNEIDSQQLC